MPVTAAPRGMITPLLTAVTTGTGDPVTFPVNSSNIRVHSRGAGTVSGGTIVIEEANDPLFSGTWSTLQTITASALTGGIEQVLHIVGTLAAIRARISSNITGGGTVTVEVVAD